MKKSRVCRAGVYVGIVCCVGLMSGCNMISGIGKDIQEMSEHTKAFIEGKNKNEPEKKAQPAAQETEPEKKHWLFG